MKVRELIEELQKLPQDDDIVITAMDDYFMCNDFEVHSAYAEGEQAQEIILPYYFERYVHEQAQDPRDIVDITGVYTEEQY